MPVTTTLSVRDLQLLHRVTDGGRAGEVGDPIPRTVVRALAELVSCDDVRFVPDVPDAAGPPDALTVPLRRSGRPAGWIVFSRRDGRPFSYRETLLVGLLRPHLAEMCDRSVRHRQERTHLLTRRQLELLRMAGGGATNRQIARRLGIAEGTVRKHLENTYARLGVGNRVAAVERAFGVVTGGSAAELFDVGDPVRPGDGGRVGPASVQEHRPVFEHQA